MAIFMGGSAYNMVHQIAEGYVLVTTATFKRYTAADIMTLSVELEKLTREVRGEVSPVDDLPAVQKKNRKLGRLQQAALIIRGTQSQRR